MAHEQLTHAAGLTADDLSGGDLAVYSPIDGALLANVQIHDADAAARQISAADEAFRIWRDVPAPQRGELVRLLGEALRREKESLAALVSLECGKIYAEGLGEVQEMIDVCDFAVGLSRQLYGLTMPSERPGHTMREVWQPLGPCAIITAFNFPVAVWAWNTSLAVVCGNPVIWKPSEKTPLTAMAVSRIFARVVDDFAAAPPALAQLLIGDARIGELLVDSPQIALVSATGSTAMGRKVGPRVAARFGRSLLELGGNNAMIVTPSADLELAVRAIVFSAVGTAGQRCTTLRRLIVHERCYDELVDKLKSAYASLPIGSPLDPETLVGPLIDQAALANARSALAAAVADGGVVTGGEQRHIEAFPNGCYLQPAIVEMPSQTATVEKETFAPILYVMRYSDFADAVAMQNAVPQGLSSCVFSTDIKEVERFLSASGSDCGIANVNIGPSGAEIGGAFGGEKETGGGRESGSDSWRAYMRRQTVTVNFSDELPLAQGINFEV
jgi:aldehyde dehydrogenase (NAD+)